MMVIWQLQQGCRPATINNAFLDPQNIELLYIKKWARSGYLLMFVPVWYYTHSETLFLMHGSSIFRGSRNALFMVVIGFRLGRGISKLILFFLTYQYFHT